MANNLMLSRIQFAANISFHILFPTINIALCWFLLFFKVRYRQTGCETWMRVYRFWVKIFALTFALGVVSGITMSFQFGTNWPGYMETVGNIAGPLLGYEVLTAFFLEATFLSVMLFGIGRVSDRVHTLATLVVATGTTMSAFWIIALDSWMQTPVGHTMIDGVAHASDWWQIIFNPSMPYRLTHMLLASGLTSAFFIAGVSAYRLLQGDPKPAPKLALKVSSTVALLLIPLQIFVGDLHGLNTLKHQPAKVAAMEGLWHSENHVPLVLFAVIDEEEKTNHWALEIPSLASLILTHKTDGYIQGLNEFSGEHPPVAPVFYGFRVMVATGLLMLLTAALLVYYQYFRTGPRQSLQQPGPQQKNMVQGLPRWLLKLTLVMTFSGWFATLAGWYVTEIGRQPYLVTGVLKTADAVTSVPSSHIALSLALYLTVYTVLIIAYIRTLFVMAKRAISLENDQDGNPKQQDNKPHKNQVNTQEKLTGEQDYAAY
ncbi:cytochrome ubiquinol oxidase subunit I [Thalassomonas haliotis]|uniref:Cytochrome ubiquinol oxidase subunit I n=1 Tax=Thalassomonas haliotis TaxID=485448 RepID=A0ABY7VKW2_9GAMM|nr:cytochrome ubiquinol oxidase subunit I [Thalassomonas haliotis]WDE14375.1 cytochrome ubiquinol oxidase subunit I [Thalassomonas haliotis]